MVTFVCQQRERSAGLTVNMRLLETFSWGEVEISCHLKYTREERINNYADMSVIQLFLGDVALCGTSDIVLIPCWLQESHKPDSLHSSAPASSGWSPPSYTAQWCLHFWMPSPAAGTPPARRRRCYSICTHTVWVNTELWRKYFGGKPCQWGCACVVLEVFCLSTVAALASVWVQCTGIECFPIISVAKFYMQKKQHGRHDSSNKQTSAALDPHVWKPWSL